MAKTKLSTGVDIGIISLMLFFVILIILALFGVKLGLLDNLQNADYLIGLFGSVIGLFLALDNRRGTIKVILGWTYRNIFPRKCDFVTVVKIKTPLSQVSFSEKLLSAIRKNGAFSRVNFKKA